MVQETHSNTDNEILWKKELNEDVILSHKFSCSRRVGIVFSKSFLPSWYEMEEIIKGCLLKVKSQCKNVKLFFVNIYVPMNSV